jgi:hypothetical protein
MTEETVKIKIPTIKTVLEIEGKDLVLNFKQLKRNERLKIQIDVDRALELLKKEDKTEEEKEFLKKTLKDGANRSIDCLISVEGEAVIDSEKITLEYIKSGEAPEFLYSAIAQAYEGLNQKLNNLKAEAEQKNAVQL